jgi:hypothetical protein
MEVKMQKIALILFFVLLGSLTTAYAQEDVMKKLLSSKSLKCTFQNGSIAKWKDGKLKIEPDRIVAPIHFDSIDLQNKTARGIGNQGASDEILIITASGITFVEQTGMGNLIFTTIFPFLNKEGDFIAVTSRHMNMIVSPLPSQYYGSCKKWD